MRGQTHEGSRAVVEQVPGDERADDAKRSVARTIDGICSIGSGDVVVGHHEQGLRHICIL